MSVWAEVFMLNQLKQELITYKGYKLIQKLLYLLKNKN